MEQPGAGHNEPGVACDSSAQPAGANTNYSVQDQLDLIAFPQLLQAQPLLPLVQDVHAPPASNQSIPFVMNSLTTTTPPRPGLTPESWLDSPLQEHGPVLSPSLIPIDASTPSTGGGSKKDADERGFSPFETQPGIPSQEKELEIGTSSEDMTTHCTTPMVDGPSSSAQLAVGGSGKLVSAEQVFVAEQVDLVNHDNLEGCNTWCDRTPPARKRTFTVHSGPRKISMPLVTGDLIEDVGGAEEMVQEKMLESLSAPEPACSEDRSVALAPEIAKMLDEQQHTATHFTTEDLFREMTRRSLDGRVISAAVNFFEKLTRDYNDKLWADKVAAHMLIADFIPSAEAEGNIKVTVKMFYNMLNWIESHPAAGIDKIITVLKSRRNYKNAAAVAEKAWTSMDPTRQAQIAARVDTAKALQILSAMDGDVGEISAAVRRLDSGLNGLHEHLADVRDEINKKVEVEAQGLHEHVQAVGHDLHHEIQEQGDSTQRGLQAVQDSVQQIGGDVQTTHQLLNQVGDRLEAVQGSVLSAVERESSALRNQISDVDDRAENRHLQGLSALNETIASGRASVESSIESSAKKTNKKLEQVTEQLSLVLSHINSDTQNSTTATAPASAACGSEHASSARGTPNSSGYGGTARTGTPNSTPHTAARRERYKGMKNKDAVTVGGGKKSGEQQCDHHHRRGGGHQAGKGPLRNANRGGSGTGDGSRPYGQQRKGNSGKGGGGQGLLPRDSSGKTGKSPEKSSSAGATRNPPVIEGSSAHHHQHKSSGAAPRQSLSKVASSSGTQSTADSDVAPSSAVRTS
ncbi:unnamed protein product [Amoebophrya sp. A120]|nr:unnamed protein product [Amoebophrya sp. A120]|eukprot:GSA120T00022496001.1